jgi:hypothetical protein
MELEARMLRLQAVLFGAIRCVFSIVSIWNCIASNPSSTGKSWVAETAAAEREEIAEKNV